MIATWAVYAVVVSALVFLAAALLDHIVRGLGRPTRFVWLGAMVGVVALTVGQLVAGGGGGLRRPADDLPWLSPLATFFVYELHSFVTGVMMLGGLFPFSRRFVLLSAVGTVFVVAMLALSVVRLRRRRARWGAGTLHGAEILVTDSLGPAVVGVRRPEIALPVWVLDCSESDQRLILEHERQHLAAQDALLRVMAFLPVVIQPWNPALWLMFRRLRAATEMDCDRRLLRRFPDSVAYASLLVDVASRSRPDRLLSPSLVESGGDLERRVRAILGPPRRPGAAATVARGLASAIVLIIAWVTPAPAARLWPTDRARPRSEIVERPEPPLARAALRVQTIPTAGCGLAPPIDGRTSGAFGITRGVRAQTWVDSAGRGYLLIARGAMSWPAAAVERTGGPRPDGLVGFEPLPGDWRNTLTYDPATNVLSMLGVRVPLDSGNVVLVDRIDGVGGDALVQIGGCVRLGSGWETIDRALATLPAVHSFATRGEPGAPTTLEALKSDERRTRFTVAPIPAIRAAGDSAVTCAQAASPARVRHGSVLPVAWIVPGVRAARIWNDRPSGVLVFVRGAPGWDSQPGGGIRGGGNGIDWQLGGSRFSLRYDGSHAVDIHGVWIPLDSGNVFLVDRIDGVGGPPIVSIAGCISMRSGRGSVWRAIATLPEVRKFMNREP
jgi:hypothetical protein